MVFVVHLYNPYEPGHEVSNNVVCVISITSYQLAHTHSLIRASARPFYECCATENSLEFLSLKGGCTGSSESTLVKMPHCWRLHNAAHICFQNPQRQRFHIFGLTILQ